MGVILIMECNLGSNFLVFLFEISIRRWNTFVWKKGTLAIKICGYVFMTFVIFFIFILLAESPINLIKNELYNSKNFLDVRIFYFY